MDDIVLTQIYTHLHLKKWYKFNHPIILIVPLYVTYVCAQAALGPVALDLARTENPQDTRKLELASHVLTIAVLSILVTAPLGAVGIHIAGPRLLGRVVQQPQDDDANI
jgi:hypothetical protein